ncbi:MAG TPA: PAS domain S-box protein [Methanobacteriaceae archaeon]|nr:PAS domain S-box protein [Methanobacteriaceae archaeon]
MSATKILVVEDEGLTAMELQRKLKYWGYEVPTFAFSSKEAVQKAEKIKPDLVLMDIVLKGEGDGIDAAREIKNRFDIPIIYLTAYGDEKTRDRAKETKPEAYLLKPFEENELHLKIEEALYQHKIEKMLIESGEWLDRKLKNTGVIVAGSNGMVRFMNELAAKLTNFSVDQGLKRQLSEIFPITQLKTAEKSEDYLQSIVDDNSTELTNKTTLKKQDNQEIHIQYNLTPIKNDEGELVGVNLIFEDVSKELKKEEALFEREKYFRGVYNQSPLAMAIYSSKWKLVDVNPAGLELLGAKSLDELKDSELFSNLKLSETEQKNLTSGKNIKYEVEFSFEDKKPQKIYKPTDLGLVYLEILISPLEFDEKRNNYLVQFQDITKHRTKEETLQNSHDNYLEVIESVDSCLLLLDLDLNSTFLNHAALEFTDLSENQSKGKKIDVIYPSLAGQDLDKILKDALSSLSPQTLIKKHEKNGKQIFTEINVYPYSNGLNLILNDITELKIKENKLKDSESLYRSVIEKQSDILCRFTPEGKLTFSNQSYQQYFGSPHPESVVFSMTLTEQEKMMDLLGSITTQNPIKIFEGPIEMPDGELRWWQWITNALFDVDGSILEFQAVGREITSHKEKEEELEKKIRNLDMDMEKKSSEFTAIQDSLEAEIEQQKIKEEEFLKSQDQWDNELQKVSAELSKTKKSLEENIKAHKQREGELIDAKLKLEDELKSLNSEFLTSKENLEAELSARLQAEEKIQGKSEKVQIELEKISKELETNKTAFENQIKNKEKDLIDLKESFEFEIQQLKEKELESRESLDKREDVLKNLYSRFKSNINMISSLSSLQSEYMMDQMVKQLQENRNNMKAIALVHEKLYQSPDLENVNFQEYLQSLTTELTRSSTSKGIKIEVKSQNVYLDMDSTVMCGLIVNELISNSLKHAFPGKEGNITVEVLKDSEELEITVSDDGVGLPSSFDFQNAESLGIQLVRTFIDQVSGSVKINGDRGTKFEIKIPLDS